MDYFAATAESPIDLYLPFYETLATRFLFPHLISSVRAIRHDIHNLGASLAKIDFFVEEHRRTGGVRVARFAETEFEYLLIVCRGLFDLVQVVLNKLWTSTGTAPRRKSLPLSYARIVFDGERHRAVQQIASKFSLPRSIAAAYAGSARFFGGLRRSRDLIVHHGHTPDIFFATEQGFAVRASAEPFRSFGIWVPETFLPNDLAPVRPVLSFLVWESFRALQTLVDALAEEIHLPEVPAPGFHLYSRGWHTAALVDYSLVTPLSPWWPP